MGSLTVYASVGGPVMDESNDLTWANIVDELGTYGAASGNYSFYFRMLSKSSSADKWVTLDRAIVIIDTSAIPNAATVSAATLSIYGQSKDDEGSITPDLNVYSAAPAADDAIAAGDFDSLGTTAYCDTPITYANLTAAAYNDFILNATGLAAISKTSVSKFGFRNANYDVAEKLDPGNHAPAWGSDEDAYFQAWFATNLPRLVITYIGEPTVTTQECTKTIAEVSIGHGNLTSIGNAAVTQHGHCWGVTSNPTTVLLTKTTLGAKPNLGQFQSEITDLSPGTKYYVRAYATNSVGTSYGANVEIAGNVTTIGRRHWWTEFEEFHYFGESGTERVLRGTPTTSDHDGIMDWM